MLTLDRSTVRLNATPRDKAEAIRQVGALLVDAGYITPDYIPAMMEREREANTYLGNGIAIPHGTTSAKDAIRQTGIAVLQVPGGVPWGPGEMVYLVVGIAARSDEHLNVLANLTDVLGNPGAVRRLVTTTDPSLIISRLSSPGARSAPTQAQEDAAQAAGKRVSVTLLGTSGLHARPATMLATLAKQFSSRITLRYDGKSADAKSLVSLLKLGAPSGSQLELIADGPDDEAALNTLQAAIATGLGESSAEATPPAAISKTPTKPVWQPQTYAQVIAGISASPGLAVGPLYLYKAARVEISDRAGDAQAEEQRLVQAIAGARAELQDLYADVKARSGAQEAAIFQAHAEFLDDPSLLDDMVRLIREGHSAAWAWSQVIDSRARDLAGIGNPLLASRANDLKDVGQRVLRFLGAVVDEAPQKPVSPIILIAEDMTPSDTASLDPQLVLGFATASGGPTSHTAILARSLDIPALVGAGPALLHVENGTPAILDGTSGNLYVAPSEADLANARLVQRDLRAERSAEEQARYEPALMTDGRRIEVVANIGKASEAEQAINAGAEGIGLFRTEFLFLDRESPPTEEEQFAAYREVVRALGGLPAIIRTLDVGGDKKIPYLQLPPEENPFLGVRGIRLCLARPDLFKPQLRALLRAAALGPVRIMYPMVTTVTDVAAANAVLAQVREELTRDYGPQVGNAPLEVGIMVEVPAVPMMAEQLAKEVDFFSIGTNDLTQYILAMDRLHPMLAKEADGLHPAVLRAIEMTVRGASAAGKWVGVCGGMAGDPLGAMVLAGLGVRELSVAIPSIAAVKAVMRRVSSEQVRDLAQRALACATAVEVRALPHP